MVTSLFFAKRFPGKKFAQPRLSKNAFCFQQKTFFSFRNFCPGLSIALVLGNPVKNFYRVCFTLYKNLQGLIGCPQLYLCRTLTRRPRKKPPMGSRSACLNAVI